MAGRVDARLRRPEYTGKNRCSCCSSHEVVAVSCPDCGAQLFEADLTPG